MDFVHSTTCELWSDQICMLHSSLSKCMASCGQRFAPASRSIGFGGPDDRDTPLKCLCSADSCELASCSASRWKWKLPAALKEKCNARKLHDLDLFRQLGWYWLGPELQQSFHDQFMITRDQWCPISPSLASISDFIIKTSFDSVCIWDKCYLYICRRSIMHSKSTLTLGALSPTGLISFPDWTQGLGLHATACLPIVTL